jgi:hypothetical protein
MEFDSTFFWADKRKVRFFSALIARCSASFCAATDEGDSKWKILQKRAESDSESEMCEESVLEWSQRTLSTFDLFKRRHTDFGRRCVL